MLTCTCSISDIWHVHALPVVKRSHLSRSGHRPKNTLHLGSLGRGCLSRLRAKAQQEPGGGQGEGESTSMHYQLCLGSTPHWSFSICSGQSSLDAGAAGPRPSVADPVQTIQWGGTLPLARRFAISGAAGTAVSKSVTATETCYLISSVCFLKLLKLPCLLSCCAINSAWREPGGNNQLFAWAGWRPRCSAAAA